MLCRRRAGTPIQQRGFMSSEVIAILGVGVGLAALILSLAGLLVTLFIRSERRSQERHDRLEAQFHTFRTEIRAEWAAFRAEIKEEMATHRAEMRAEWETFRAETREELATHQEELAAHKTDTARQFAAVNARLDNLQASLEQRFDAIERSQAKLEGQLEIIQGLLFQRATIS